MIRAILASMALALGACAQPSVSQEESATAAPVAVDWQAARTPGQCADIGGDWRPICLLGKPACVVSYADAGKACSDSAECSGRCIANDAEPGAETVGRCTANSDPCGCFQLVTNGKADYALCAD